VTVQEIEDKAWSLDGIRIVIRDKQNAKVSSYSHQYAVQANWTVSKYIASRIEPLIGDREVIVVNGEGVKVNGNTLVSSVRNSY